MADYEFLLQLFEAADARGATNEGFSRALELVRARDAEQRAAGVDAERERVKGLINKIEGYKPLYDFYREVADGKEP